MNFVKTPRPLLADILRLWHRAIGEREVAVAQVMQYLPLSMRLRSNSASIGRRLAHWRGQEVGGYRIERGPRRDGRRRWRVVRVSAEPAPIAAQHRDGAVRAPGGLAEAVEDHADAGK